MLPYDSVFKNKPQKSPGALRRGIAGFWGLSCAQAGFHHFVEVFVFHGGDEDFQHDAVFVHDESVGIGTAAAQGGVVSAVEAGGVCCVILGEDDVAFGVVVSDVGRGGVAAQAAVDGDDGDFFGIFTGDLVEVGQFVDAGGTPGAPEVHNGDLAGAGGVDSLTGNAGGVYHGQIVVKAQVAHLVATLRAGDGRSRVGGGVPVVGDGAHQNHGHDDGGDGAGNLAALGEGVFCTFVGVEGDLAALEGDGLGGAHADALAAGDALLVAHVVDVQLTVADAQAAAGALGMIHLDAEEGELIEQAVQAAQGADKPAEAPEREDAAHQNADHQQEFPGEQGAQHGEVAGVDLVGQQADAAFQGARGTDVFAEGGQGGIPEGIHNGDHEDEEHQNGVL